MRLDRLGDERWRVRVGEHPLSPTFRSEHEARNAGVAEVARLDAVALALLRRVRSRSRRKQR